MKRWFRQTRAQDSLQARIDYLSRAIDRRQWGWRTRRYARQTVKLYPRDALACVYAFMVCIKAKKFREAARYELLATVNCHDLSVEHRMGFCRDLAIYYIKRNKFNDAELNIEEAYSLYPQLAQDKLDPNLLYILHDLEGRLMLRMGKPERAADIFKQVDSFYVRLGKAANLQFRFNLWMHWMHVATLLGDVEQARELLRLIKADAQRYHWRHKLLVAFIATPVLAQTFENIRVWRLERKGLIDEASTDGGNLPW